MPVHSSKDFMRFPHSITFPSSPLLADLDEIVRSTDVVQVPSQPIPPVVVVGGKPSANDEIHNHLLYCQLREFAKDGNLKGLN